MPGMPGNQRVTRANRGQVVQGLSTEVPSRKTGTHRASRSGLRSRSGSVSGRRYSIKHANAIVAEPGSANLRHLKMIVTSRVNVGQQSSRAQKTRPSISDLNPYAGTNRKKFAALLGLTFLNMLTDPIRYAVKAIFGVQIFKSISDEALETYVLDSTHGDLVKLNAGLQAAMFRGNVMLAFEIICSAFIIVASLTGMGALVTVAVGGLMWLSVFVRNIISGLPAEAYRSALSKDIGLYAGGQKNIIKVLTTICTSIKNSSETATVSPSEPDWYSDDRHFRRTSYKLSQIIVQGSMAFSFIKTLGRLVQPFAAVTSLINPLIPSISSTLASVGGLADYAVFKRNLSWAYHDLRLGHAYIEQLVEFIAANGEPDQQQEAANLINDTAALWDTPYADFSGPQNLRIKELAETILNKA